MSCQFKNTMQTKEHWLNRKKKPQWRRRNQKHHCNQHLKKEKTQKAWINNVVGQTAKSVSNRDIKRNASHHHMFVIPSTHTNEEHYKNYKYPIVCKNLECHKNNTCHC
jgi:hypothetical protein